MAPKPLAILVLALLAAAPSRAQLGSADLDALKKAAGKGANASGTVASLVINMDCESAPVPKKIHDDVPAPGPDGKGADRAGYAKVNLAKNLKIAWMDPPPSGDAKQPFYMQQMTMLYKLDKIDLYISSDFFPTDSETKPPHDDTCPYAAIRKHERSHAADYRTIAESECRKLEAELWDLAKTGKIPSPEKPWKVKGDEVEEAQGKAVEAIKAVVMARRLESLALMAADKAAKDGTACYCKVYKKCDPWTWRSTLPAACKTAGDPPPECKD